MVGIEIVSASTEDQAETEVNLLNSLRSELPQGANQAFGFKICNDDGLQIAGLSASTSYGWLLIKLLWVEETCRGRGLASQLMDKAEERGRSIGCHSAWLDSSNPEAKLFYEKRGYEIFGLLENQPGQSPDGHKRWFMKRTL